jgi:hypothetical protein
MIGTFLQPLILSNFRLRPLPFRGSVLCTVLHNSIKLSFCQLRGKYFFIENTLTDKVIMCYDYTAEKKGLKKL